MERSVYVYSLNKDWNRIKHILAFNTDIINVSHFRIYLLRPTIHTKGQEGRPTIHKLFTSQGLL